MLSFVPTAPVSSSVLNFTLNDIISTSIHNRRTASRWFKAFIIIWMTIMELRASGLGAASLRKMGRRSLWRLIAHHINRWATGVSYSKVDVIIVICRSVLGASN